MNMLQVLNGYRTYLMAIIIIIHQLLKSNGIDIPQENLSMTIDVMLSVGVLVFRKLANKPSVQNMQSIK